ncbi:metallophosphoesterase family protein [Limosilactobacillus gastricus]|uniref:metallophosphoesterase family protein n=1 Tax=Limosilactobacillus gastricus TaxID=227942 RepID=UPI0026EC803F|nr:metallophosphoesterase family protein [Limosilactobacillus gastricus]
MKQKIAVLADVHGNLTALQAMYEDSQKQGVDQYWFLGDLLMPGPGVMEVWHLLQEMQPSLCVRGNWDDLAIHTSRGEGDLTKPSRIFFARLGQYVAEQGGASAVNIMEKWPIHQTVTVGPLNFALSHNLPGKNLGQALFPTNDVTNFDQLLTDSQVDIAIYAHVHHQLLRYGSDERIILNPGSVGEPFNHHEKLQRDLRAYYLIMEIDDYGLASLNYRHVYYDREVEYQRAVVAKLPYLELYRRMIDTGRVDTHNQPLLDQMNQKYRYREQYQAFQKSLH